MLASNPEVVAGSSHGPSRGGWVYPYLWFAPALVLLLAVTLYPTALVIWLSFNRTRFYEVVGWAGLSAYASVLSSDAF
jgi:multiple sugar transport system permease protein